MKKIFAAAAACILALQVCPAAAQPEEQASLPARPKAELSVTQQDVYFTEREDYGVTVYCYVKIENTGNVPAMAAEPYLTIIDKNGYEISAEYWGVPACCLQPGEYTYYGIESYVWELESIESIKEYSLRIEAKEEVRYTDRRLSCEAALEKDRPGRLRHEDPEAILYATATNDTDEPVNNIGFVVALLDEDDHILYVGEDRLSTGFFLMPGSSLRFRDVFEQCTDIGRYFAEQGISAAKVDAIAYTESELPQSSGNSMPNSAGRNLGQTFSRVMMTEAARRVPISQASARVLP